MAQEQNNKHDKHIVEDLTTSTTTVWILFFLWVVLVLLLIYLYKRLNRQTDGRYTIRQIVYGKGGVRDRVRGGVVVLEARLGLRLWPRSEDEEAVGEEDREDRDIEGGVERGSERGDSGAGGRGEEEEEGGDEEGGEGGGGGDDSSDDYSSMEGSDVRERAKLLDAKKEERRDSEGKRKEKNKVERGEGEGREGGAEGGEGREGGAEGGEGRGGGGGLLIDLKQFSGSAIWSEEKNSEEDDDDNDLTEL